MANKHAKVLDKKQFQKLLTYIDTHSTMPIRDRLVVHLSFKAGLRVAEIAQIDFKSFTDAEGNISDDVFVPGNIAKKKRERLVPMNRDLKAAITAFMKAYPGAPGVAISSQPFQHGRRVTEAASPLKLMSPNTLTVYYRRLLVAAGFEGASSHSGRRTFATDISRVLSRHHQSIRDLQKLMGHARLDTTERYIEPSKDTRKLVDSI